MAALGAPSIWQAEAPGWRAYREHDGDGPSGPRPRARFAAIPGEPEYRPGLPHRRARQCRRLRVVAVPLRQPAQRRRLQLSSSCRRSTPPRSPTRRMSSPWRPSLSWRSSSAISPRAYAARRSPRSRRAETTEQLYLFSRKLSAAVTLEDLIWATGDHIALMLDVRGHPAAAAGGRIGSLAGASRGQTSWAKPISPPPAGAGPTTAPRAVTARRIPGPAGSSFPCIPAAGWSRSSASRPSGRVRCSAPISGACWRRCADQAALAIERINLARDVDRARLEAETDRLRSALLTSISHDLRTPLASILGSGDQPARPSRDALDESGQAGDDRDHPGRGGAAEPLHRQSPRHDAAGIRRRRAAQRAWSICPRSSAARLRARRQDPGAPSASQVRLPPDLPMLKLDVVLFEQVLFNLLDNAAKYAPAGSLDPTCRRSSDGRQRHAPDHR